MIDPSKIPVFVPPSAQPKMTALMMYHSALIYKLQIMAKNSVPMRDDAANSVKIDGIITDIQNIGDQLVEISIRTHTHNAYIHQRALRNFSLIHTHAHTNLFLI